MSFFREFCISTRAIRAIPASLGPSNRKIAGIAENPSPETRALAVLTDACDGLSIKPDELGAALDEDRAELEAGTLSADALRAFAVAVVERRHREAGEVPEGYTESGRCACCGPVYLPPGRTRPVNSCQWCFNRLNGHPIPRPEPVRR